MLQSRFFDKAVSELKFIARLRRLRDRYVSLCLQNLIWSERLKMLTSRARSCLWLTHKSTSLALSQSLAFTIHYLFQTQPQSENKILTTYRCHQWSRGTLTAPMPGVHGIHPLLSGGSTLRAN